MNKLMDEDVIARLRSALDEVTADSHGLVAADAPRPKVSAARWMAVAAAAVLIVGAVAAIAINRGAGDVATAPTDVPTTPATEPTLIRTVAPRYTLIAEDLAPGKVEILPNALTNETSMVWALGNPVHGLFMLRSGPGSPNMAPADTSLAGYQMINDQAVAVSSYGIDLQEQAALLAQVQQGSGLPWLLPAEGWSYLGMGTGNDGPTYEQGFLSDTASVILAVGPLANQFLTLATFGNIESVTVAGRAGWKATGTDGAYVLWPAADSGQWASMSVPPPLTDRIDGLIAAVVEVTEEAANEPTIDTVPVPTEPVSELSIAGEALPPFGGTAGIDPAVGMPAPTVFGSDYAGNEVLINPADGPHLVMFQAHWCPHCAANLPNVVTWMADGTIPSWLPVTLVSTAEDSRTNYPPSNWLAEMGWTGAVLRDPSDADGAAGVAATAYGATGWPYFVVIGVDGTVLARANGELSQTDMESLLAGLPDGPPAVVGRLEIPKISVDWVVVEASLGLKVSARSGPVFVGGTIPTELPIGEDMDVYSMIYGNRTTYGAPFLDLDQLVVGDTFTWTDESGTAIFEVVSTNTCPADSGCPGVAGALVLTTPDPAFTSGDALYIFARRTA